MPAKKIGHLRKFVAVIFTSIVAPVLANVFTQELTDCRQTLTRALEDELAGATADWTRLFVPASPPPAPVAAPQPMLGAPIPERARPTPPPPTAAATLQAPPWSGPAPWRREACPRGK